jgi:hypothetical protein
MNLLISLLIVVLVLGLVWWIIASLPISEPFRKVGQVIFAIIAILVLLSFLPGPLHIGWGTVP